MNPSLSPFAPESLVSRDVFGSPVSRQSAHLKARAESGAFLRDPSRVPRRRPFIYLNRDTVYQCNLVGVEIEWHTKNCPSDFLNRQHPLLELS